MSKKSGALHILAVCLALVASVVAVVAVANYEAFIPNSYVWNFTAGELGTFSALAVAGAIGCAYAERIY